MTTARLRADRERDSTRIMANPLVPLARLAPDRTIYDLSSGGRHAKRDVPE
jgi:hypothetical protein